MEHAWSVEIAGVDDGAGPAARGLLVVEDDAGVREVVLEILREAGYRAVAVGDGRRALDFLREHELPGLVLLDMVMPGMDGWEFLAEQRRDPRLAEVPVVAMTGLEFPF